MKVCMFHLMPYRDLPADFESRYESVWITPPNRELLDPRQAGTYYNQTLDELELADRLGFDGICVNEHHQNAYGFMPSPNLMAAALARRTERAALVVLGNTLALYPIPTRVAEEFAMLDCISGGRLVAGFPVGTSMDVNYCYGIVPAETRPRFYEAHDLIVQAWTRPGPFPFNGQFFQLRYVNPWPRPIQQPHPPIWLAGGGSVETWEFAGRNNYAYNYLSYFGFRAGRTLMEGFWETMARMGVDDNPYRAGFLQLVCVAETDARAEQEYLPHVQYFYKKCLHIPAHLTSAPGYQTPRSVEFGLRSGFRGARAAEMDYSWKSFVEKGHIVAGSPATVRDRLIEAARSLRLGHIMVLLQIGSMPHDLTEKNIRLFATEVMPTLQRLWDDEGYEDRWWPRAVARDAARTAVPAGR
jgi:alkanesulfonate monooxygenase SsuD/methylene tetrahydromethanopterin reductase-like flavin-dependent oxidoreductase (luciferase family)